MRALLPALLLIGCADPDDDPCANALTYDDFGQAMMAQYCTGCHSTNIPRSQRNGAPPTVNLDHYAGVVEWADVILEVAAPLDEPSMPPGGGTTALERDLLREWLTCQVADDSEFLP